MAEKFTAFSPEYPRTSTGRRRALAQWITSRENPLAARVADGTWLTPRFCRLWGQKNGEFVSDPKWGGKDAALAALNAIARGRVGPALELARRSPDGDVRAWAERRSKGVMDE